MNEWGFKVFAVGMVVVTIVLFMVCIAYRLHPLVLLGWCGVAGIIFAAAQRRYGWF